MKTEQHNEPHRWMNRSRRRLHVMKSSTASSVKRAGAATSWTGFEVKEQKENYMWWVNHGLCMSIFWKETQNNLCVCFIMLLSMCSVVANQLHPDFKRLFKSSSILSHWWITKGADEPEQRFSTQHLCQGRCRVKRHRFTSDLWVLSWGRWTQLRGCKMAQRKILCDVPLAITVKPSDKRCHKQPF